MDVDVRTETVIGRPRGVVAGYAADPDRAPDWYARIRSVRWETPGPLAVGSRIAFRARFLGRELAYTYEVLEWLPGERMVMATAQGPFPMRTTYTWTDAAAGSTHMTLANAGRPTGFGAIAAPLLAAAIRRANRADLARLRQLLEAPGA